MELFFLCTIIMAAVSFLSIALSQPPSNLSLNISDPTNGINVEPINFIEGAYSELPSQIGMVA